MFKEQLAHLRRYFFSGLIIFLPMVLTIYFFIWVINFADSILSRFLEPYFIEQFGFYFKGLSILIGIYIIVLIGFLATNLIGRQIYSFFDRLFGRLPLFKQVYPALKEMSMFLFAEDRQRSFKKAVIIEYPRREMYVYGFLMNDSPESICQKTGREMCNVFVPSSPGPLTGFVMMVPKEDIIYPDISVEQVFKFIVSGGVVNPRDDIPQAPSKHFVQNED